MLECTEVVGYLVKNNRRSYLYSRWTDDGAKKFTSEQQANTFHGKMRNKDKFSVMGIEGNFRVLV